MNLPAGLIDDHYEIFTDGKHAFCLHNGRVIPFSQFPPQLIDLIDRHFDQYPEKRAAVREMGFTWPLGDLEQLLICNYGGFDNIADIRDGKLKDTEFWPCPCRGTCKYEGIVCDKLRTASGENLTPKEIQVVKHIAAGALDKNIADLMNISVKTVTTHTRNIRRKTKLYRKSDITRFAIKETLIDA